MLVALVAVVTLLGCGGSDDAERSGSIAAGELRVGLVDFDITTAAAGLAPGRIDLDVTNAGSTGHDLVVEAGAEVTATEVLEPGEGEELAVTVPGDGAVTVWCSVAGHRAQGMELALPVRTPG